MTLRSDRFLLAGLAAVLFAAACSADGTCAGDDACDTAGGGGDTDDPAGGDTDDTIDLSAGGVVVTVDGVVQTFPYGYCAGGNCGASTGDGGPGDHGMGIYPTLAVGTSSCVEGELRPALVYTETADDGVPTAWGVGAAMGVGDGDCTITVTTLGTTSGEWVEGTFSGTLLASNGATPAQRVLTNGRFSLPVQ